jgi:predicted Zn finger-like uncharacterized protein
MLIVCPNCETAYRIDPSALGTTGRQARCVRCGNVRFSWSSAPLSAIAQAFRAEIQGLPGSVCSHPANSSVEAPVTPLAPHSAGECTIEAEQRGSPVLKALPLSTEAGADAAGLLEAEVNEAIALCGGDVCAALRATLIANAYLEAEIERLIDTISTGLSRGRRRRSPRRMKIKV